MRTPEQPVIVEVYGQGVETRTQVQADRVVYQVWKAGVLQWAHSVYFPDRKMRRRRAIAAAQDREARRLLPDAAQSA